MIHDVVSAAFQGSYRIEVTFDDGKQGIVDFTPYLKRGGVFKQFRDLTFFREFRVDEDLGTLTWGDEIDIAPETLYAAATGAPLPDWMTKDEPSPSERSELVLTGGTQTRPAGACGTPDTQGHG